MPDKQPIDIDYARAESADVVRKKFRRRVVVFVIATVVVIAVAVGWLDSSHGGRWNINRDKSPLPVSVLSDRGWIIFIGPDQNAPANAMFFASQTIGFQVSRNFYYDWAISIRYRTLFILAMIPWIITLIRLIRSWKGRRVLSPEC